MNTLLSFGYHHLNYDIADPRNEDAGNASIIRLLERKLAYEVSYFPMPYQCKLKASEAIKKHHFAIMANAEWGRATAGAGRIAATMSAMSKDRSLELYQYANLTHVTEERAPGIWFNLFGPDL